MLKLSKIAVKEIFYRYKQRAFYFADIPFLLLPHINQNKIPFIINLLFQFLNCYFIPHLLIHLHTHLFFFLILNSVNFIVKAFTDRSLPDNGSSMPKII